MLVGTVAIVSIFLLLAYGGVRTPMRGAGSGIDTTTIVPYPNPYLVSLTDQANSTFGMPSRPEISWLWYDENRTFIHSIYGANFTAQFVYSNTVTTFDVPMQYTNLTAPFLISIIIWNSTSPEDAAEHYGYYSLTFQNSTQSNIGNASLAWNGKSYGLSSYRLVFLYRTYLVEVDTLGNTGEFSSPGYTYAIASHLEHLLVAAGS